MIFLIFFFCLLSTLVFFERYFKDQNVLLKIVLSVLLTLCILSYTFIIALFFEVSFVNYQIALIIALLFYLVPNYKKVINLHKLNNGIKFSHKTLAVSLSSIFIFSLLFFNTSERWGKWDAWAIWSSRAKFLISDSSFNNLFADGISWTHTDYPLMLASMIALIWKSIENTSALVPLYVAYFLTLLLVLLMFAGLVKNKTNNILAIGVLVICSSSVLLHLYGSKQYSDTLLGLFYLTPLIIFNQYKTKFTIPSLIIIGFFAASCAWVKNEGLAFFILFFLYFSIIQFKNKLRIGYFILGALIPISVILYFKIVYAPSSNLVEESSINSFQQLIEFDRYTLICDYIINFVIQEFPLIFILLISAIIIDYKFSYTFGFKLIVSMLLVYFFVYVLTPKNLDWHLKTSIDRVFHQLTPMIIYSVFYYYSNKYSFSLKKING